VAIEAPEPLGAGIRTDFSEQPERPEFWCKRFASGVTPWETAHVPATFARFVAAQTFARRTLIPGCGSAREAVHLARLGWPVTALDFSPQAIVSARRLIGEAAADLVCDDFFTFKPPHPYALIYERAFLCALPRTHWTDWSRRVGELLAPGGLLAGYFFVSERIKGPPFGILAEQLAGLLDTHFDCLADEPVSDSVPVFAESERWQIWRRR
jgi:thiopurine S-methyltransferase